MKRRISNHGRRSLALVLALIMCISLMNITALAAEGEQTPGDNPEIVLDDVAETTDSEDLQKDKQIVDGWLAANPDGTLGGVTADGKWNETTGKKVRVSKTIAPTGTENDFEVTLTVKTKQDLQEINYYPDAAITLVIDISASMSQCAICGKDYHKIMEHEFEDGGPQEDDSFPGETTAGDGKCDYPVDRYYYLEQVDTDGDGVLDEEKEVAGYLYCNLTSEEHTNHEFVERIDAAKESACEFIDNLIEETPKENGKPLAHRWVSLVSFSDWAKQECGWVDITADNGEAIKNAINSLVPNLGERPGTYDENEPPVKVDPSKGYNWGTGYGCAGSVRTV